MGATCTLRRHPQPLSPSLAFWSLLTLTSWLYTRAMLTSQPPLVVDDAASYVSFDESVGTFAGGPSLDALSASPGQHTVGTLRTFDDASRHSYK